MTIAPMRPALTPRQPKPAPAATAATAARRQELADLAMEAERNLRLGVQSALLIGLRILAMEAETSSRREAIALLAGLGVPERTCYRWSNAAAAALMRGQGENRPEDLRIPAWEAASPDWIHAETILKAAAQGSSIRRLLLGAAAPGSDEHRQDELVTRAEAGDPAADEALDRVARGEITLVQAIRAASGAAATRGKHRADPVYLTLDGRNGQPKGLFCKSCVTLANTFARWHEIDEAARRKARQVWLETISLLPPDLL